MTILRTTCAFVLLLAALPAVGQQNNPPPVKGMASTVGLYVYPG
jgi:hypothetical protein